LKLPYKIYSHKVYWNLRNKILRLDFSFKKKKAQTKEILGAEKYKITASIRHFKSTFKSILRTLLLVTSLFLIEHFSTHFWTKNLNSMPGWLVWLQAHIPKPSYPDDKDAIIELISVIASVTGVILALFYPILATIISSAYSKVHDSIRSLVLKESVTQDYLKKLTSTTSFSISVLLALSLGIYPGNLILSILFLYTLINLFNLLKIGLGVYTLLEPSNLLNLIIKDIFKNIQAVTINGLHWNDRSFQHINYYKAYKSAESLNLITQLCVQEYFKEGSFILSAKKSLAILNFYLSEKPKIPIDSYWFPTIYTHSSFFASESHERSLSKNTSTFVQPKTKQNHFWLEEKIVDNISIALETVLKVGNINVLSEVILTTYGVFDSLGASLDLKTGKIILNQLSKNIVKLSNKNLKESDIESYEDCKHQLGAVEAYCYAILRFQVGVIDRMTEFKADKVILEYNKINWKKKNTIYHTDFVPDLFETLNNFYAFVQNEKSVEGHKVTPDWYFRQSLIAQYLIIIAEKFEETIGFFRIYLLPIANSFMKEYNSILSSFTAHIGLELIQKIRYRLEMLKPTLTDIDQIEVCKGEFKWTKPNFTKTEKDLADFEHDCITIIGNNIEQLSLVKWDNQFPDVFAQSYSVISTYLNNCFLNNELENFQTHFKAFLKSAITAFGNLNDTFKHFTKPQNISYQTLIDIMEISGYSYIYSIIYKKPEYWDYVKEAWDNDFPPTKQNIELLTTYYSYYRRTLYGTGVNYTEKHQREITLSEVIKRAQLVKSDVDILATPFIENSGHSSFYNVSELFIEIYLFTFFPEAKSATALLKREFFKHICRSMENFNSENNATF
jgi:hypothetical protein